MDAVEESKGAILVAAALADQSAERERSGVMFS